MKLRTDDQRIRPKREVYGRAVFMLQVAKKSFRKTSHNSDTRDNLPKHDSGRHSGSRNLTLSYLNIIETGKKSKPKKKQSALSSDALCSGELLEMWVTCRRPSTCSFLTEH